MNDIQYYTRGQSSPQGKHRVYFTAYPDDYRKYFNTIRKEILDRQNCAVFFLDGQAQPSTVEDYEICLEEMQLFVVPVTRKLLTFDNRAIDFDIPFAIKHHIPVLPIIEERGLDKLFSKKLGDLQYLDRRNNDSTAINYSVKLTNYLESVIIGDELTKKVRSAFNAYIFLSYRKKDRKQAKMLMHLIHSNPIYRDVAIWYDEFLTPGEDFNEAIHAMIEKCTVFALVVTPNLINELNYILSTEYPLATELNKDILTAELIPTDRNKLRIMYHGIPDPVRIDDSNKLNDWLLELMYKNSVMVNDSDPTHFFYIGLAYLLGIDVEVNHERAVELILSSANAGCSDAIQKLVDMYRNGEGVPRDYKESVIWQRKFVENREQNYLIYPSFDNAITVINAIRQLGDYYYGLRMLDKAVDSYKKMMTTSTSFMIKYKSAEFIRQYYIASMSLGDVYIAIGKPNDALEYYNKALGLMELPSKDTGLTDNERDKELTYIRISKLFFKTGALDKSEEYCNKTIDIIKHRLSSIHTVELRRDLSVSYMYLGDIYFVKGFYDKAEEHFRHSHTLTQEIIEEDNSYEIKRDLSVSYNKLAQIKRVKGDSIGAVFLYKKSLAVCEGLVRDTGSLEARRDLSIVYFNMGDISRDVHNYRAAKKFTLMGCAALEAINREADTLESRRDLMIAYSKLGGILYALGQAEEAYKYYSTSLKIGKSILSENDSPSSRDDLAQAYYHLGIITQNIDYLNKALSIWIDLSEKFPNNAGYLERSKITRTSLQTILDKEK